MKKLFKSLMVSVAALMLVASVSFADPGNGNHWGTDWNPGNHYGWGNNNGGEPTDFGDVGEFNGAAGAFDVEAEAFGAGVDYGYKFLPRHSGAAGGIGGVIGGAQAEADGFVFDGTVGGNVSTIGGGFSETDAYRFNPGFGDTGIGVGSWTQTSAVTGAHVDVNVDPDSGFGAADGSISGFVAMGSLNGSVVGASPLRGWKTEGYSAGVAGQGAVGAFEGGVVASSGPDVPKYDRVYLGNLHGWGRCNPWNYGRVLVGMTDSNANAFASANISMTGFSQSESYRFMSNDNGFHTEGMGTFVEAETNVTSYGYSGSSDNGLGIAGAGVHGGYVAAGGTGTQTVQFNDNGIAKATAVGGYVGAGSLNTTFHGNAKGYSNTSMTTHPSANGVISRSSAGMQVTAQSGNAPH